MASFQKSASQLVQELGVGAELGRKRRRLLTAEEAEDLSSSFVRRLESVAAFPSWALTLARVSPWELARRGWVGVEESMVQCSACSAHLSTHLPSISDPAVFRRSVAALREAMVSRHATTCAWRSQPTPESDLLPNVTDPEEARRVFVERAEPWKAATALTIPSNAGVLNDLGCPDAQVSQLFTIAPDLVSDLGQVSYLATGWLPLSPDANYLHCDLCRRSLPLRLFSAKSQEAAAVAPAAKKARLQVYQGAEPPKRVLHPLKQHHSWCPWLHSSPQASAVPGDSAPLWRAFVDALTKAPEPEKPTSIATALTQARQLMREGIAGEEGLQPALPLPPPQEEEAEKVAHDDDDSTQHSALETPETTAAEQAQDQVTSLEEAVQGAELSQALDPPPCEEAATVETLEEETGTEMESADTEAEIKPREEDDEGAEAESKSEEVPAEDLGAAEAEPMPELVEKKEEVEADEGAGEAEDSSSVWVSESVPSRPSSSSFQMEGEEDSGRSEVMELQLVEAEEGGESGGAESGVGSSWSGAEVVEMGGEILGSGAPTDASEVVLLEEDEQGEEADGEGAAEVEGEGTTGGVGEGDGDGEGPSVTSGQSLFGNPPNAGV